MPVFYQMTPRELMRKCWSSLDECNTGLNALPDRQADSPFLLREVVWMSLLIPDEILQSARMSADEMKQELAVVLFQREKLALGQASRLAGMNRVEFQHLLASRRISPHYDVADFEADLNTLRELNRL